ncbi:MAG: hypothetical protein JKY50_00660 [Oleispira sp.]|nr:hypothetical protein [Oleispira sp.]
MIKRYYEAFMITIAIKILAGRNVTRAAVVSRRDNNKMAYISEELETIAADIKSGYKAAKEPS